MRSMSATLHTKSFLCVLFFGACVVSGGVVVIQSLPWPHVSCPARCACQIRPWFSPESVYHEAPTVDCNDLLLTQLPFPLPRDTHTLRLQSNLLSSGLESSPALHALPNLTELDLSQNRLGRVRTAERNLSLPSLQSLHLEENQLARLPHGAFCFLPGLQELFLSHNRLHWLAPGAFTGLDSLLRLHINNNRLSSIDPRWFGALPRLEVLMLGGNPVEVLPEQGFRALGSLRSLVLGGMGLRGLAEDALEGLDHLESLSFYDNLLTRVPTRALGRVPSLKFLDLNKNRIGLVGTGDFRDMAHLKELGLSNMEALVSIERAALENLPELTKLEITNNPRLSYVHPQAFSRLSRLESLMLNSNGLSALHRHTLRSLPGLQEVSLHSNPLRCDCLFRWAAEEPSSSRPLHADKVSSAPQVDGQTDATPVPWPRAVRFIQPRATLCSEPPELRARRVRDVSANEMSASCLPAIAPGPLPPYVAVREGGSLALHCRALAEPQPQLYWVTPSGLRLGPAIGYEAENETDPAPGIGRPASQASNLTNSSSPSSSGDEPGKDHTPLRPPNSYGNYRLLPEGTLEISAVSASEAGLYMCIAENALGADTRSVTVGLHAKDRKRKGALAADRPRTYPGFGIEAVLEVREVGEHYAVLSWQNGHNGLPSTRLSWQAVSSAAVHRAVYTTRILAGTQSFNLTHLHAETFYRVCLHLGVSREAKRAQRRARESTQPPQCIMIRTKVAPPAPPEPSNPHPSESLFSYWLTLTLLTFYLYIPHMAIMLCIFMVVASVYKPEKTEQEKEWEIKYLQALHRVYGLNQDDEASGETLCGCGCVSMGCCGGDDQPPQQQSEKKVSLNQEC